MSTSSLDDWDFSPFLDADLRVALAIRCLSKTLAQTSFRMCDCLEASSNGMTCAKTEMLMSKRVPTGSTRKDARAGVAGMVIHWDAEVPVSMAAAPIPVTKPS
jgi:hypothetical protein